MKDIELSKRLSALPVNSKCCECGKDLSGEDGWVVKFRDGGYETMCPECHDKCEAEAKAEVVAELVAEKPAPASVAAAPDGGVAAALATLTAALTAPKAPPVDEAAIRDAAVKAARDEAVKAARDEAVKAAQSEAKAAFAKTVADFLKDGTPPSADDGGAEERVPLPSAKSCGVDAAASAFGWKAKATPDGKAAVEKLNAFLSEFSYFRTGVSMRLINTFARADDKRAALRSYCEVSQMEDLPDLVEKMKSPEFEEVCKLYAPFNPEPLNKRFAVFYGSPGGGKTYAAIKAGEKINGGKVEVVPCSPSMDAADMLYAYRLDYKTGRRGYVPTALLTAMMSGRAVVLDEVNLLPMEARMFLQNILDNKSKVSVMGVELPIANGFFVLGTMNLETGLGSTPLPLPLVDRAAVVKEFRTTASQAAVGAGLC